jgi:hypothetical protein
MIAQVAFFRDSPVTVEGNGMIRTYINAEAASGTLFLIQDDDTVISLYYSLFGTRSYAVRFIAMPADIYPIDEIQPGPYHPGTIFGDMDQFDSVRRAVFLLAGNLAGFASPAGFMVYDQYESIHGQRFH